MSCLAAAPDAADRDVGCYTRARTGVHVSARALRIYRLSMGLVGLVMFIYDSEVSSSNKRLCDDRSPAYARGDRICELDEYEMIYATNWAAKYAFTVYASLGALIAMQQPTHAVTRLCRAYRVMRNILAPSLWLVTLVFWALLGFSYKGGRRGETLFLAIWKHGLTAVVLLVDGLVQDIPFRLWPDLLHPLLFSVCYITFTMVYLLAGNKNQDGNPWIYRKLIHWDGEAARSVVACSALVLVLAGLYWLLCSVDKRVRSSAAGGGGGGGGDEESDGDGGGVESAEMEALHSDEHSNSNKV